MPLKKSHVYIFLCLCIIFILIVGIYFSSDSAMQTAYILKATDGSLAVFSTEGQLLENISPINLSALPDADRKKLQEGIPATSEEELVSLIEDFLC